MKAQEHSNHFTARDIERYLSRKMSAEEMHAMEKAALDDPFLADAIEGFSEASATSSTASLETDVNELELRLQERIQDKKQPGNIASGSRYWWRIAAAVMLLAGTAGLVYTFLNTSEDVATNQLAKKENVVSPDTVVTQDAANIISNPPATKTEQVITPSPVTIEKLKQPDQPAAQKQTPSQETNVEANADERSEQALSEAKTGAAQAGSNRDIASAAPAARQQRNESAEQDISFRGNALAQSPSNNFFGKVVDLQNRPIANASVLIKDKNIGVNTDSEGNFKVITPDSNLNVTVASVGFMPAEISLDKNRETNRIVLKPVDGSLSEVVVTGYGTQRKRSVSNEARTTVTKTTAPVSPAAGWPAFLSYIEKNRRRPVKDTAVHGSVIISFSLNKKGKPTDLKVEQSLTSSLDAEALRLVKQGPAWNPIQKNTRARVQINF